MTIVLFMLVTFAYPFVATAVYPIYRKLGGRKTFDAYIYEIMN